MAETKEANVTRSTVCAGLSVKADMSQGTRWEMRYIAVRQH